MKKLLLASSMVLLASHPAFAEKRHHGWFIDSKGMAMVESDRRDWEGDFDPTFGYNERYNTVFIYGGSLCPIYVAKGDGRIDTSIHRVNGQLIKFSSVRITENNDCYTEPTTKAGQEFLRNAFKYSTSVSFDDLTYSGLGFNRAIKALNNKENLPI